jgi:hypothetical protein
VTEADDEPKPAQPVDRDAAGRFTVGNQAARANRGARMRRALETAARAEGDEERLVQVLRALHAQAVSGDVAAARTWLEHVVGRPRERRPDIDVALPAAMATREDFGHAFVDLARVAAAGELDVDAARGLAALLTTAAEHVIGEGFGSTEAIRAVVADIVSRRPATPVDQLEHQKRLRQFLAAASAEAEGDQNATAENADEPLPEGGAP